MQNAEQLVRNLGGNARTVGALRDKSGSKVSRYAALMRACAQLQAMAQLNADNGHTLVCLETGRRHRNSFFTCCVCTASRGTLPHLRADIEIQAEVGCEGRADRADRLRGRSNKQFWWKATPDMQKALAHAWQLTASERSALQPKGEKARSMQGRKRGGGKKPEKKYERRLAAITAKRTPQCMAKGSVSWTPGASASSRKSSSRTRAWPRSTVAALKPSRAS